VRVLSWRTWVWVGGVAAVVAALAYVYLRRPHLTPELRGQRLAGELGCFGCHGPGGTGGTANPGSEDGEVPAWDGGMSMMFVKNEGEISEWILYGHPLRDGHRNHKQGAKEDGNHEEHASEENSHDKALLDMPAYKDIVSKKELADLVAYYKAVAVFDPMPADIHEGYRTAKAHGCFGCHGPGGLVGRSNPRSFKGYIPPWRGKDFHELVKSQDELREWILDGHIDRLESNPAARFFTNRQVVHMPAYEGRLSDSELDGIVAYIQWLQSPAGGQ
jgi:mono/diheme cytochrome c family protein